jgi:hypothetical protein
VPQILTNFGIGTLWAGLSPHGMIGTMAAVLFRCPRTGTMAQSWIAEDVSGVDDVFVSVECPACGLIHLVNPNTRETRGEDE